MYYLFSKLTCIECCGDTFCRDELYVSDKYDKSDEKISLIQQSENKIQLEELAKYTNDVNEDEMYQMIDEYHTEQNYKSSPSGVKK